MNNKQQLELIFDIVKNLYSTLDIDVLLKRIGETAQQLTNSEASSIMLVDEDKQHLYFKIASGEKSFAVKKIKIKIGEGIAGTVALTKKTEIINDVSKDNRFDGKIDRITGFNTRSILAVPMLTVVNNKVELIGVLEVLNKKSNEGYNEDDKKLLESLAGLASAILQRAKILEDQRNFFANITEILVSAIESIKPKYKGSYWRMVEMATKVAKMLNIDVQSEEYKNIYFGTLLHDIGYLSAILRDKMEQAIDVIERAKVEQYHVIIGADIVSKINLLKNIAPIIKHHHECYDGTGYPEKLSGDDIPIGARIIAVVEYVEELRVANLTNQQIIEMVQKYSGSRFDPNIVKLVTEILSTETTSL